MAIADPSFLSERFFHHLDFRLADLYLDLALVAVVEETISRGFMYSFLRRYTSRTWLIVIISAVAFGAIHWSDGFTAVMITAAAGAIFMALYAHTQSLPAIMAAHFSVDLIILTDLIPKSIFRFL